MQVTLVPGTGAREHGRMLRDLDVGSTWSNMLLLGGLEPLNFRTFHSVGNGIVIPTGFHIFQGS